MRACKNYSSRTEDKVDKGNKDQHRMKYTAGISAVEEAKWGASKARERYGRLPQVDMRPKDMSMPQFKQTDGRAADWADDHPNDWVRGFGKNGVESAEGYPNFDRSKGGRR